MAIGVAHIGTGNFGTHALRALITDPEFELTGVCVLAVRRSISRYFGWEALSGVVVVRRDADKPSRRT